MKQQQLRQLLQRCYGHRRRLLAAATADASLPCDAAAAAAAAAALSLPPLLKPSLFEPAAAPLAAELPPLFKAAIPEAVIAENDRCWKPATAPPVAELPPMLFEEAALTKAILHQPPAHLHGGMILFVTRLPYSKSVGKV